MSVPFGTAAAVAAARTLERHFSEPPSVGIILGSGLGGIADAIESAARVPYRDIPGFPAAAVKGHAGELVIGKLAGKPVVALSGRFHMYEGHDAALAAFPVRVFHALGVSTLIVSNAAGGLRPEWKPGTLMLIRDHINLTFRSPLAGPLQDGDERFPDMSEPYDKELLALAREVGAAHDIELKEGVYVSLLGPTYETRAETRMLQKLGADATGMSTVPEVIVARARGMRVLGMSCITNLACGLAAEPITHAEVIDTTARVASRMQLVVRETVAALTSA